jgi:hypothetical protein
MGEQSGLPTRTESVSLCVPMKTDGVSWNWNLRFALAAE